MLFLTRSPRELWTHSRMRSMNDWLASRRLRLSDDWSPSVELTSLGRGTSRTDFEAAFGSQQWRPDVPANLRPFEILGSLLDEAVLRKILSPDARRQAEFILWPALHGLAVLASSGPLLEKSDREVAALCDDMVLTVLSGLNARMHPASSHNGDS